MATKKEWAWRGLSFLGGFLAGRYAYPKQYDQINKLTESDFLPPSEQEYADALQCIIAGIYLCIRTLIEDHSIYEIGKSRLGPIRFSRLDSAVDRWSNITTRLSKISVEEYDNLIRDSLNHIIAIGNYPANVKIWISSLDPKTLVRISPPVGRLQDIAYNITYDLRDKSDEYIAFISQKIAENFGTNYIDSFQMSGIELAQCFKDLATVFKIILITSEKEIENKISREWYAFLYWVFTSYEFIVDYRKCDECGWLREVNRRDNVNLDLQACPDCGSLNLVTGVRDLDT